MKRRRRREGGGGGCVGTTTAGGPDRAYGSGSKFPSSIERIGGVLEGVGGRAMGMGCSATDDVGGC